MEFISLTFDKVQLHSSVGSKRFALNDFLESLLIFSTFSVYLSKITVAIANPQIQLRRRFCTITKISLYFFLLSQAVGNFVALIHKHVTHRINLLDKNSCVKAVCASLHMMPADIDIVSAPEKDCTVYGPVRQPKDASTDRYAPRATDSAAVAAWRQRIASAEAQAIYKERAATAECVNALARNRRLRQQTS